VILALACCGRVHTQTAPAPVREPWWVLLKEADITITHDPAVVAPGHRELDFEDFLLESGVPPPPPPPGESRNDAIALMRDAAKCATNTDYGGLWIKLTIDPAGRPIAVDAGGFGDQRVCVIMAARARRFRELRGTVTISLP
jgi:hypothetical protein